MKTVPDRIATKLDRAGTCPDCGRQPVDAIHDFTGSCLRCKMVWITVKTAQLRDAQRSFFSSEQGSAMRRHYLDLSRSLERQLDTALDTLATGGLF